MMALSAEKWLDMTKPDLSIFPISHPTTAMNVFHNDQGAKTKGTGFCSSHVVYFLRCHDFVKIGWTKNLRDRMCMLQCGNPYDISLIYYIAAWSKEDAIETERWVHDTLRFQGALHNREWFKIEAVQEFIGWIDSARYKESA